MNSELLKRYDPDGRLTRKVLERGLSDPTISETLWDYMLDFAGLSISKEELCRIISKKRITQEEKFVLEWAIIRKRCTTHDFLQICQKKWKNLLQARVLYIIILDLLKDERQQYRELLLLYLEKCENYGEISRLSQSMTSSRENTAGASTLALIGNCNLEYLSQFLELASLTTKLPINIYNSGFDQWINLLHDQNSDLYHRNISILLVYLSSLGLTRAASEFHLEQAEFLCTGLEKYLSMTRGKILIIMPEPLEEEYSGECRASQWRKEWISYMQQWREECHQQERIRFCELEPIIEEVGREKWFAPRYWYHAKLPCGLNTLLPLGRYLLKHINRLMTQPVKVIVCDLDNTLWGGIVGEDGWQNIDLDPNGAGGPFIRLQFLLKQANENGILLAIASKNDEMTVREVFSKRREMVLQWDNFTAVQINWSPKPANIKTLATILNIGLQHFCFLDDSPFERAAVREALPEVWVPELSKNPEQYVSSLIRTGLFISPQSTEVDRARPALYRAELSREMARKMSADYDSFLKELSIRLYPLEINDSTLSRCEQLLQRTNQFNVTVLRLSEVEIGTCLKQDGAFGKCYRVIDRFGDSGIVGVLLAVPEEPLIYRILCWVLSCRAMGRHIEYAMFDQFTDEISKHEAKAVRCCYMPTQKNSPMADLLPSLGFQKRGRNGKKGGIEYQLNMEDSMRMLHFVDIIKGTDN